MPKVSIIVPIYNGSKYLRRCIESLSHQTLEDIEIILVNDGSTDESFALCTAYAMKDTRIQVIHQANAGVSVARNVGMAAAQGKYIGFVDVDDYIEPDMYQSMYDKLKETQADLCVCYFLLETNNFREKKCIPIQLPILNKEEMIRHIFLPLIEAEDIGMQDSITGFRSPWSYLYKKDILQTKHITFEKDLPIGEDFLFNLHYMCHIQTMVIDPNAHYHYCIHEGSATQKYRENWWQIHKCLVNHIEAVLKQNHLLEQASSRLVVMRINYWVGALVNECHKDNPHTYKQKLDTLTSIRKEIELEDAFTQYNPVRLSKKRWLWFWLIRCEQVAIVYLLYRIKLRCERR